MNLFSTLQDPAATKMRQAVRLFAEALLELAAEPGAVSVAAPATSDVAPHRSRKPGKSSEAIRAARAKRMVQLGARRRERIQELLPRLRELAGGMQPGDIALALGIGTSSVYRLAKEHDVDLGGRHTVDAASVLPRLRELAGTMPIPQLCEQLGFGKTALYRLAKQHEIELGMPSRRPGKINIEELRRLAPTSTIAELMAHFDCTDTGLRLAAKSHDISLLVQRRGRKAAIRAEVQATELPRPLTEVSAAVDEVPSTFSNGAWIERDDVQPLTHFQLPGELVPDTLRINGLAVAVDEAGPDQSPALEGISYSITTPDRSPPSPELIEALQPVVEAAVAAMRADAAPVVDVAADPSSAFQAPSPTRGEGDGAEAGSVLEDFRTNLAAARAALEEEAIADTSDEEDETFIVPNGEALGAEAATALEVFQDALADARKAERVPAPVERRPASKAPAPYGRPRKLVQGAQKEGVAASKWVRLQHADGKRWLRGDGLGWVEKRQDSYLCLRTQLPAALRTFELARECKVISEPSWTAKDISYSGAMR